MNRKISIVSIYILIVLALFSSALIPNTLSKYSSTTNRKIVLNIIPNTYTVVFHSNNGLDEEEIQSFLVGEEKSLRTNSFTKEGADFSGWNTEIDGSGDSYNDEEVVSNLSTVNNDIVDLYAQWEDNSFVPVYTHTGACVFHGDDGLITGDECSEYHDSSLINTGIALFSEENYDKDFEVSFNIDHYVYSEQKPQAGTSDYQYTLLNTKLENAQAKYPGYTLRNNKSNSAMYEITGVNPNGYKKCQVFKSVASTNQFALRRLDGKMYYSINGGPFIYMGHDTKDDGAARFDTPLTIGGSLSATLDSDTGEFIYTPFRVITGTLSNIQVKIGKIDTTDFVEVKFNGNGGNTLTATYHVNDVLGDVTTTRDGYVLEGWYTKADGGEKVESDTIVTGPVTYYAHWKKSAKQLKFQEETITLDVGDTYQLTPLNADEIGENWSYSTGRAKTATVTTNGGLIKAVNIGKTYIRVKGKTTNQYKDLNVIVRGSVYDMTFTDNPINIVLGNTYDAYANISNISDIQEGLNYSSSSTSIFTVDSNGIITPKKEGSAKLIINGKISDVTVEIPVKITSS